MAKFIVSYSFDIKDRATEEIVFWKRDGMEIEAKSKSDIDTSLIKEKIKQMAEEHCTTSTEYVSYANYYAIEPKKKGKK